MAYFRCASVASGGGNGADLIVTCSQNFAGKTITCTDGSSYTKTQTCPSSSPYEVIFESIPTGTYTISGVISGQTFSTTKTITDFDAALNDIPDGATVTPTDDVQILLHCANIWDKAYTTISQLLADTTSLLAVISDNNAVDYLVRSTTFATDVCANSTAMTDIGANNYCANTLLADSTWRTAICNSTYIESVLNVKVPTMTSDTTPSGTVIYPNSQSGNDCWHAFNGNTNDQGGGASTPMYIGYTFTSAVTVYKCQYLSFATSGYSSTFNAKLQALDGSDWIDLTDTITVTNYPDKTETGIVATKNIGSYSSYRLLFVTSTQSQYNFSFAREIQFYGRS